MNKQQIVSTDSFQWNYRFGSDYVSTNFVIKNLDKYRSQRIAKKANLKFWLRFKIELLERKYSIRRSVYAEI